MIEEKYHKQFGETKRWLEDGTGHKYRRVCCGTGWPFGEAPGFVVVLAEDLSPDFELDNSPRHLRVLAEFEEYDFERLHRKVLEFNSEYHPKPIVADRESSSCEIFERIGTGEDRISPTEFYGTFDLNLIAQLIARHTRNRKTLHFTAGSRLPGYISAFDPAVVKDNDLELFPAVTALGYCLAEMEKSVPSAVPFTPKRRRYYSY